MSAAANQPELASDQTGAYGMRHRVHAVARSEADLHGGEDVLSRRAVRHGGRMWTAEDVGDDSGMRLYRAVAADHSILAKDNRPDHRIPADPDSV